MKFFTLLFSILICAGAVVAQQSKTPVLCKYKTDSGFPLSSEPKPNAPDIGKLPKNKVFQAIDKKSYWVKFSVKGIEGWAPTTALERMPGCPQVAELEFHHNGYKIIGGVYRYYFGFVNTGTASYADKITMRLYKAGTVILEKTIDFKDAPVEEMGGGPFYLDTTILADKWEFITTGEKVEGATGELIEVIQE